MKSEPNREVNQRIYELVGEHLKLKSCYIIVENRVEKCHLMVLRRYTQKSSTENFKFTSYGSLDRF